MPRRRDAEQLLPVPDGGNIRKGTPVLDKHFEVGTLARMWNLSDDTIRRMFRDEPGVIKWVRHGGKRPYVILRIPQPVAERVYNRMKNAA